MEGFTATRHDDGGVTLGIGEAMATFTKTEWCQLVADVSIGAGDERTVAGAALIHEGRFSVAVDMDSETIGRVVLRRATGLALPNIPRVLRPGELAGQIQRLPTRRD